MLKNKHVIAALIITPVLAVLGYFAVDYWVTEKPHAAREGQTYRLVARSSCRYASGHCELTNGEFKLELKAQTQPDGSLVLSMSSAFPLDGSKVALVDSAQREGVPMDMRMMDEAARNWQIRLPAPASTGSLLRLVAAAEGSMYFGETGVVFTQYETAFGEDFRGVSE